MDFLSKPEYEAGIAATRDKRMKWWREARSVGGYLTRLISARLPATGEELPFEQDNARITVRGLPESFPDSICNVGVVELIFEDEPKQKRGNLFPQLHNGDRFIEWM